jgi:cyanophycinase
MKCHAWVMFVAVVLFVNVSEADQTTRGHLLIIGGGLLPDNSAVYERMITYAGGPSRARFGILPTASANRDGAQRFAERLEARGVPANQIDIIDLNVENATRQASNPAVSDQIRRCTGLFIAGGDQRRITRALLRADATETAALQAIVDMWERGGLIAGSSAGAAVQGDPMISVSGLPNDSLDIGMDALDFGLTKQPSRRGVLVSRGLGLFRGGLVDQHFNQERGRLGRLARVAIEERIRFGFGIDENTALDVAPDGTVEVVGAGYVTIVESDGAKCADGPLGCRMTDITVSCLAAGDRFDPKSGEPTIYNGRTLIVEGTESMNGNHLIPDISSIEAVRYALFKGLADNTSRRQMGVTLTYNRHHGHGYQFKFTKSDRTRSYTGEVNGIDSYSVVGVQLNIEPVVHTLESPTAFFPSDLAQGPSRQALASLLFRGILLLDERRQFRPNEPISRGELANALAHTIRLEPSRRNPPRMTDVPPDSPQFEEIALVVGAGLMETDAQGAFRMAEPVVRREAAAILVRLSEAYNGEHLTVEAVELDDAGEIPEDDRESVFKAIHSGLVKANGALFRPDERFTRQQAAEAIYRIIGFPW